MKGINNVNTVEYIILKIFSHTHMSNFLPTIYTTDY
jgi:hypothetical protein